jgi:hypothetical protein
MCAASRLQSVKLAMRGAHPKSGRKIHPSGDGLRSLPSIEWRRVRGDIRVSLYGRL